MNALELLTAFGLGVVASELLNAWARKREGRS